MTKSMATVSCSGPTAASTRASGSTGGSTARASTSASMDKSSTASGATARGRGGLSDHVEMSDYVDDF